MLALVFCLTFSLLMLLLPDEQQIAVAHRLSLVLTEPYWRLRNFGEDILRVRGENALLQAQVIRLEQQLAAGMRAERDARRELVAGGLRAGYEGRLLPCQVVARELGRSATMVKIRSVGPAAWRLYQAVLAPTGLIGRIRKISGPEEVWVELLTAPDMALGCEIERTGLLGVLRTRGSDFVLDMISRDESDVQEGDRIITSGIAEIRAGDDFETGWALMPRGLPVGLVKRVDQSAAQLFLDIQVKPLASFRCNMTVFVVLDAAAGATGEAAEASPAGGERRP